MVIAQETPVPTGKRASFGKYRRHGFAAKINPQTKEILTDEEMEQPDLDDEDDETLDGLEKPKVNKI